MPPFCVIWLVMGLGKHDNGKILGAFTSEKLARQYLGPNPDFRFVRIMALQVWGD
jgi:uncharacterized protein YneF (UPF0154 family)